MPENENKSASKGLSANAYVELGAGESYEPYVSASRPIPLDT